MTQQDDIRELKEMKREWDSFKEEQRVQEKVKAIVKLRCAAAWASIFTFTSAVAGFIAMYSDVAKEASKAAVKIIIARMW